MQTSNTTSHSSVALDLLLHIEFLASSPKTQLTSSVLKETKIMK